MKKTLSLFVQLLSLSLVFGAEPNPCSFTNTEGHLYDLTPLKKQGSDYYIPKPNPNEGWDIWLNICQPLFSTVCGSGTAGCQQWDPTRGDQGKASMGSYATQKFSAASPSEAGEDGQGVVVSYSGGKDARNFRYLLKCKKGSGAGQPILGAFGTYNYDFNWETEYACLSASSGLSPGSIILITMTVLIVVYLIGGVIFKKFVKKEENGINLIPNIEFWREFPGLVKSGVMFIINKVTGRGGYSAV